MSSAWLAVNDEIQTLVRIFLAIFVLIGLIPFFQKTFSRFYEYIISLRRPRAPGIAASMTELEAASAEPSRMNEIEYLVFRQLSQGGARGVSLTSLAQILHMDSLLIRRTLQSLHRRGLVRIVPRFVIGRRFSLSEKGQALAVAEGLTPKLSRQKQMSRLMAGSGR